MLVLRRLRSVPWSHLIVLQVPDDAGHHSVPPDGHRDVGDGGQKLRPVSPTLREERRRWMDSKLSDEDFKIFFTTPHSYSINPDPDPDPDHAQRFPSFDGNVKAMN